MTDTGKIDWFAVARKIFEKYGGTDHSGYYHIYCPCESHDNTDSPACVLTPTVDRLAVWCHVCEKDENGANLAYAALRAAGDLPNSVAASAVPHFLKIWDESVSGPVFFETYTESRGLNELAMPPSIRVNDQLYHSGTRENHVGIVCSVTDANEKQVGIHRTYLNGSEDGKLDHPDNKMMLGRCSGGHVTVRSGKNILHIAEGLETTLAVLKHLPSECSNDSVWAALSAPNLGGVDLPTGAYSAVHIWADYDRNGAGLKHARKLAQRLSSKRTRCYIHLPNGDLTNRKSIDWLDIREQIDSEFSRGELYAVTRWEQDNFITPANYLLNDAGVTLLKNDHRKKDSDDVTPVQITTFPVWVSARFHMLGAAATSLCEITYFDRNCNAYLKVVIETAALSSVRQLHDEFFRQASVTIDHRAIGHFCVYLHHCYEACTVVRLSSTVGGWIEHNGRKRHALYDPEIEIHTTSDGAREMLPAFHTAGSYEKWQTNVLGVVTQCFGSAFIFAASLAAPIFSLFGIDSIPVTTTSSSGAGKTVSVHAAISAWCQPKTIEMSGDSSLAGIRAILNVMQDVPTLIDEVQLKATESLTDLIYAIGNSGKSYKATRDGESRKAYPIRTTAFFTGERCISESVKYNGANVRIISLRDLDVFEELRGGKQEIDDLRRDLRTHYGHFGPEFIRELSMRYHDGSLQSLLRKFEDTLITTDALQIRQSERYAAMLVGCSVLGDMLGEQYSKPLMDAVYRHWSEAVEEREPHLVENKTIQLIKDHVVQFGTNFGSNPTMPRRDAPGEWQHDGRLAILSSVLDHLLKVEGFDPTDVKRSWKHRGWLSMPSCSMKSSRFTGSAIIGGTKNTRCVVFTAEAMADIFPESYKSLGDHS